MKNRRATRALPPPQQYRWRAVDDMRQPQRRVDHRSFQALGRERAGWQCGERYLRAVSDVARVLPGIRPQERQILGRSADVGSATRHGKASAGLLLREGATGHGARAVSVACGAFHRRPGVHFHGPLHAREDGRAPIRPRNRRNPATGVCQVPGQTTGGGGRALPRRRHVSRLVMPLSLRGGKLGCNSTRKDPWVTKRPCGIRVMCGNAASSRANTWGLQPRLRHGRIPAGIRSLGCLFRLGTGTEPGTRAIQRTTAIASGRPFRNSASCACRPRRQRAWPPLRDSGRLLRALSARAGSVWKSAANEPCEKCFSAGKTV
jgi:hypothetical protein